jgi:hypothetical protein
MTPAERAAQLVGLHPGQVDQADDHPLVGHPDDHPPVADPGPPPQVLDRGRHGDGVDDLAVDDRALRQAGLPDALEHSLATADRHLGRAYRGGADVESDDLTGHVGIPLHVLVSGVAPRPPVAAVEVIDPANSDLEKLTATAWGRPSADS